MTTTAGTNVHVSSGFYLYCKENFDFIYRPAVIIWFEENKIKIESQQGPEMIVKIIYAYLSSVDTRGLCLASPPS